jgi:hypothetical protein
VCWATLSIGIGHMDHTLVDVWILGLREASRALLKVQVLGWRQTGSYTACWVAKPVAAWIPRDHVLMMHDYDALMVLPLSMDV